MELWTGIACLAGDPNCKDFRRFVDQGRGAYVNIVTWASSRAEFEDRIQKAAKDLDCIVLELKDIQLLERRMQEPDCPKELIDMRATAQRQRDDIVFGDFHVWTEDEAN
jgi:hypothetical protein